MTTPQPITLLTWSGECDSCAGLLQMAGRHAAGLVGFFYAPQTAARFFRLDAAGQALGRDDNHDGNQPLDLSGAYEVRLFDGKRDIRGRKDGARWRVAIVSDETAATVAAPDAVAGATGLKALPDERCCHHREQTYLLWGRKGRGGAVQNGWTKLTTARIGPLWVPHDLKEGCNGILVIAREYFRTAHDGNVVFAAERLTGFRSIVQADVPKQVEETIHG